MTVTPWAMSNDKMDEERARRFAKAVASALGITLEQLESSEWSADPLESDEGVPSGYAVTRDGQSSIIGPIDLDRG